MAIQIVVWAAKTLIQVAIGRWPALTLSPAPVAHNVQSGENVMFLIFATCLRSGDYDLKLKTILSNTISCQDKPERLGSYT